MSGVARTIPSIIPMSSSCAASINSGRLSTKVLQIRRTHSTIAGISSGIACAIPSVTATIICTEASTKVGRLLTKKFTIASINEVIVGARSAKWSIMPCIIVRIKSAPVCKIVGRLSRIAVASVPIIVPPRSIRIGRYVLSSSNTLGTISSMTEPNCVISPSVSRSAFVKSLSRLTPSPDNSVSIGSKIPPSAFLAAVAPFLILCILSSRAPKASRVSPLIM